MNAIRRINAQEARARCLAGAKLVCAYDSDEAFRKNHLGGAISLIQLKNQASLLSPDDEIIFYCA